MSNTPLAEGSNTRRRDRWLGLAAALLVVAGAYAGMQWWQGPQVPAVPVQAQALVRTLQFSARVETQSRVVVGSTIVGRVQQVHVQEGDRVQPGQTLLQLEDTELLSAMRQAQGRAQEAALQLEQVRSQQRIEAQSQRAQAQAQWQQVQADWQRHQQLVAQGFLSQSALDEKRKALAVAQAQLQSAQAQVQALAEGGAQWRRAQAQVAQAEAAMGVATSQWRQTRVMAPSAGQVLRRTVEPGQIVQSGTELLQLALHGPQHIVAQVDERFLEQLQVGQSAQVVADAFAEQRLAAKVVAIAPGVDAQRGAVEVKLALDAPPPAFWREDMTLSVSVETARRDRALVLPLQALQGAREGQALAKVLVLEQGRAVARSVRVGLRNLEQAEILQGLDAGATVLLPPAQEGQRVRPAGPAGAE